jgi:hypothetical protein
MYYVHRMDFRLNVCLRPLADCRLAGLSACPTVPSTCRNLPADLTGYGSELRNYIVAGCSGVPVPRVLDDLGFAEHMAGCQVDSLASFASCLGTNLRRAQGALVGRLDPESCAVLAGVGLHDVLADEACGVDPTCKAPPAPPASSTGPVACGGSGALACPAGSVCNRSDSLCTQNDMPGVCVPAPTACSAGGTPVCGCDGKTYSSDCDRLRAGVTLARNGACDPPALACGQGNPACPTGMFCDYPRGDCGEGQPGVCRPQRGEPCNLCSAFVGGAVCGCDFTTYASDCERQAAGVSAWFDGSCQ